MIVLLCLWRRWDTICSSDFVDDVMFPIIGPAQTTRIEHLTQHNITCSFIANCQTAVVLYTRIKQSAGLKYV